jgi:hypothetical protein
LRTAPAIGLFARRDHAYGVGVQIRPGGQHAHFFAARHRMAAHKMRAGFFDDSGQLAHDIGLHAADVGDNGAAFEGRQKLLRQRTHLRERRAENHQVGVGNGRQQVGGGIIHRAGLFAILQTGLPPDKTSHFARQLPLSDSQSDGAAEQADADEGDLLELHARRIADGGKAKSRKAGRQPVSWKMEA